ncbi:MULTISPECIES: hypothetical protein [Chitinophagaceae]|uniref:hypothetical protein n=1 Tax=Chitinophagaceae TaxID=563835 RepID=UPI000DEF5B9E|nr:MULTISPECIES: hypothetical protein [Chitinophagaceae]RPD48192.1 hypothetical protein DRJ53_10620 [Paracnuella aquatica]
MARLGLGPLLLAGAAAFGYYKYSKMTAAEKDQLKQKAMKVYEDNVPQNVRDMINGKQGGQHHQTAGATGGNYNGGTDGFSQM